MQLGSMPSRRTSNAMCIVKRIQEDNKKKKLHMCLVDIGRHLTEFQERSGQGERKVYEKELQEQ